MIKNEIFAFLNNKSETMLDNSVDQTLLIRYKEILKDDQYFDFIKSIGNGGFFFNQSLHIYSFISTSDFFNIQLVNDVLSKEFGYLFEGLFSFGQEVFGNQFAFDKSDGSIVLFNVETGDRERLSDDFEGWLKYLIENLDYLTGNGFVKSWCEVNSFHYNQRLVPKVPFVIGGEYEMKNFYASAFPKFLLYYADLAKQIHNLKDGEKVRLRIENYE